MGRVRGAVSYDFISELEMTLHLGLYYVMGLLT